MPPCKGCLLGCEDKTCILGAQREEIDDRHPPTMLLLLPRCRCLQRAISGLCLRGSSFPLSLFLVFSSGRVGRRFLHRVRIASHSERATVSAVIVGCHHGLVMLLLMRGASQASGAGDPRELPAVPIFFLFVLLSFVVALRLFLFVGFFCHFCARGGVFHEETFRGGVLWTR